ncbi:MAG: glycosyltransferase [Deltaproteobacteria bacterium]|jgi:glycosyltransferase involved in cell wall biosynthesis|nr:glycosyltransferase [Deltaproteobacteria bacterium]
MILKGYPRISETFISNEILLLERLGFNIHLISMRRGRENFTHESVRRIRARVDYLPETLLAPLPKFLFHNSQLAAQKPRLYAIALKTAVRRFRRTRKSATIKHLLQAGVLVHQFLPASHIVHLHAHFAHSPTSVAMFAGQLSGLDFSFTAHAKDIYTTNPAQLREKISLAKFVFTCTEYNKQHLLSLCDGLPVAIHRIYHGIDTGLFTEETDEKPAPLPPYEILTVARMIAKKGLPTIYKALKILSDQGIAFHHTLIGDGEDREVVVNLIQDLGLSKVTQIIGTQPHAVVLDHYRRAALFVLGCEIASNGDRDGIPNVCLESMAMGVPVATTDVSAIPELIENEKTGLLVPARQPEQLAQAMLRMLMDQDLRSRVIPAARKRIREEFDNKMHIQKLADVYSQEIEALGN